MQVTAHTPCALLPCTHVHALQARSPPVGPPVAGGALAGLLRPACFPSVVWSSCSVAPPSPVCLGCSAFSHELTPLSPGFLWLPGAAKVSTHHSSLRRGADLFLVIGQRMGSPIQSIVWLSPPTKNSSKHPPEPSEVLGYLNLLSSGVERTDPDSGC